MEVCYLIQKGMLKKSTGHVNGIILIIVLINTIHHHSLQMSRDELVDEVSIVLGNPVYTYLSIYVGSLCPFLIVSGLLMAMIY